MSRDLWVGRQSVRLLHRASKHHGVSDMQIVGIDCAAQPKNTGYAYFDGDVVMAIGAGVKNPAADIVELVDWASPVLIAMDAPLGWPEAMGSTLVAHRPGEPIETLPNEFFRRRTDRVVHDVLRKPPLDVGADRIARTAHGALKLLHELRARTGERLPVVLDPWTTASTGVVEVYPAGTLKARGYPFQGYKTATPGHRAVRAQIVRRLEETLVLPNRDILLENDDALDAVVCVLAAMDFMAGECVEPGANDHARMSEGWIWVRDPALLDEATENR